MAKYDSLEEVRDDVIANSDVLTMTEADLRDAHGAGRLGVHVRSNITKGLDGLGLSHYPLVLSGEQLNPVRVYRRGTPAADLIGAVINASAGGDAEIREKVAGEATEILGRVRELVCDESS